jgi:hypothetical protein
VARGQGCSVSVDSAGTVSFQSRAGQILFTVFEQECPPRRLSRSGYLTSTDAFQYRQRKFFRRMSGPQAQRLFADRRDVAITFTATQRLSSVPGTVT